MAGLTLVVDPQATITYPATDFETYARLEARGATFSYVLVTNEFDPARLAAACDMRRLNQHIFTDVVHVNPNGPMAIYKGPVETPARTGGGISRAMQHIQSGRLSSLQSWLIELGA